MTSFVFHRPLRMREENSIPLAAQSMYMAYHIASTPIPRARTIRYAPPTRNIHMEEKDAKRMNLTSPTALSMFGSVNASGQSRAHAARHSLHIGTAVAMDEASSP